jgi:hypothetical protein
MARLAAPFGSEAHHRDERIKIRPRHVVKDMIVSTPIDPFEKDPGLQRCPTVPRGVVLEIR